MKHQIITVFFMLTVAACGGEQNIPTGTLDAGTSIDAQTTEAGASDGGSLVDSAVALCSALTPAGACPAGRVCNEGACIVDLDPKKPVQTKAALERLDKIWAFYDKSYGAFAAKTVDWTAVKSTYRSLVQNAKTEFWASWLTSLMVSELEDGHSCAWDKERCKLTSNYRRPYSNCGACVTDVKGRLFVYRVSETSPSGFQIGDELLSIDGRDTKALLTDLQKQPACVLSFSTAQMARAQLVAGLLFRAPTDKIARVRRAGQQLQLALSVGEDPSQLLSCDGRVGPPQITEHAYGITSALLPSDLFYVHLPVFGGYDEQHNFVIKPVIEVLRSLFEQASAKKGMILDLRGNVGGSPQVYLALASWLFDKQTKLFTCQNKTGPGHADLGTSWPMTAAPDAKLQYNGPLAVLVNPLCMSAADYTPAFLQQTGRAKTFGAPTGGAFGNGNSTALDSSWTLGYNDILCRGLDGKLLEGHPPQVDFLVEYQPTDLAQGVDTVIEQAKSWLLTQ